ncbi:site-specific integrase [Streptomyces umbrinus]|uniref:site-specific integrase n=1 Tax=Streptomyces umbrinus TaxID=67370 RepID=UPI0033DF5167
MHHITDEGVALPANVVSRIARADVPRRTATLLSPEQIKTVASVMRCLRPRYSIAVWLGACAGLRKGELLGLKWEHVDLQRGLLTVQEQLQFGRTAPLKSKASYATLAMDYFLTDKLVEHLEEFPSPTQGGDPAGYVLTEADGKPVSKGKLDGQWRRAVRDSGLPSCTRLTDLRVFYISTLANSNNHSPKKVQKLARHAFMAHTWDLYALPPLADTMDRVSDFTIAFGEDDESAVSGSVGLD